MLLKTFVLKLTFYSGLGGHCSKIVVFDFDGFLLLFIDKDLALHFAIQCLLDFLVELPVVEQQLMIASFLLLPALALLLFFFQTFSFY
jgi:hypothetical protein